MKDNERIYFVRFHNTFYLYVEKESEKRDPGVIKMSLYSWGSTST